MSKINTKKITQMLMSLKKANELLIEGSKDSKSDMHMLVGCQQIAITIGEVLKVEGEAASYAYNLLEQYCTNLFLQAENLDDDDMVSAIAYENRDLLAMIESDVVTDMDRAIETAFKISIVPAELQEEARVLVEEAEYLMEQWEEADPGIDLEEVRTAVMLCKYQMAI